MTSKQTAPVDRGGRREIQAMLSKTRITELSRKLRWRYLREALQEIRADRVACMLPWHECQRRRNYQVERYHQERQHAEFDK